MLRSDLQQATSRPLTFNRPPPGPYICPAPRTSHVLGPHCDPEYVPLMTTLGQTRKLRLTEGRWPGQAGCWRSVPKQPAPKGYFCAHRVRPQASVRVGS